MALSAILTTPLTTVPAEYQVQCHITISNSGSSAVTINQIRPAIKSTPIPFSEDKSSFAAANLGAKDLQIPAGGSAEALMVVVFHGSNRNGTSNVPIYSTYDMGCRIFAADGSVTVPTPIAMTVLQNTGGK